MKKLLSLVLALTLVLTALPVFGAEKTAGEMLKDLGLVLGDENGNLKEANELTRYELAVLLARLNGKAEEAKAFEGKASYDDEVVAWAAPYVGYAKEQGWLIGKAQGTKVVFDGMGKVTEETLAAVLLRVVGHNDVEWGKNVATLDSMGVVVTGGNNVTRGNTFDAIWGTLNKVKVVGKDVVLGVHLGVLKPEVKDGEVVVESVKTDNLKVLVVKFSGAVDKASAETDANVVVKNGNTTVTEKQYLSEDGMTLYVVLQTAANQSSDLSVVVKDVKVGEKTVAKYEGKVFVQDTTVPSVVSAVALNAKQLEVTFSEPVQFGTNSPTLISELKLDNKSVTAKADQDFTANKVTFTFPNSLSLGDHSLEVKGAKDYAGIVAPTQTFTVTVAEDKTAPVATSVEVVNNTTLRVTFDESLTSVATSNFKVNGAAPSAAVFRTNTANKVVDLTIAKLGIAAIVEVKVEYKDVKDILGNKVKDFVTIVTKVADDTTLPTVEVKEVKTNYVVLTFSKSMTAANGKVQLQDAKGKKIAEVNATGNWVAEKDNKELKVVFTQLDNKDAADYQLVLDEFKDATIRENALPKTTLTFKGMDTKAPTVETKYKKAVAENADPAGSNFTIYFSEEMDRATLENLSNYIVDKDGSTPKALSVVDKAKLTVADDAKSVVIFLPTAEEVAGGGSIKVVALKDLAGNLVGAANVANAAIAENVAVTATKIVSGKVLEVTFDSPMSYVDPALVSVGTDSDMKYPVEVKAVADKDNKVYQFTFADDLGTTVWANIKYNAGYKNLATSVSGQKLADGLGDIAGTTDGAAPVLKMSDNDKKQSVANASDQKLTLVFSEEVSDTKINEYLNRITVKVGNKFLGVTGTARKVSEDNKVEITLDQANGVQALEVGENTVVISQFLPSEALQDAANNKTANFSVELTVNRTN